MANVKCYHGATGAADGSTWADAFTTLAAAVTGAGAGGTVYVASDHVETFTGTTPLTLACTLSVAEPIRFISCDRTAETPTYLKATAAQINITGTGDLTISGEAVLVGMYIRTGDDILSATSNCRQKYQDCTIVFQSGVLSNFSAVAADSVYEFVDTTFVCMDAAVRAASYFILPTKCTFILRNCTFSAGVTDALTRANLSLITANDQNNIVLSGTDFSVFTGLSSGDSIIVRDANSPSQIMIDGCKKPSGADWISSATVVSQGQPNSITRSDGNNFGLLDISYLGTTSAVTDYVRTGGASDGDPFAWKVVTGAACDVGKEYFTPWISVRIGTTGSKTITGHIANATANLTSAKCWMEVEYLGTTSSTVTSYANTRVADILAAGTAYDAESGGDWTADLAYMQTLTKAVTVNKAGLCRVRYGFAAASETVYIDPKVTVS